MTKEQEKGLNDFFVHVFNKINIWETQALRRVWARNLSVKEIHVLEAVSEQAQRGQNTMSAVAESLSIQTSTLTAAVRTLVRKGYLTRQPGARDRRQVYIALTPKGGGREPGPQPVPRPDDTQRRRPVQRPGVGAFDPNAGTSQPLFRGNAGAGREPGGRLRKSLITGRLHANRHTLYI